MSDSTRTTTRKVGYLVAVIVNAVMMVIVNNILAWGWFSRGHSCACGVCTACC